MNIGKQKILEELYHDPGSAAGFSSANQLLTEAQKADPTINRKDVNYFLAGDRVYTLHRPRRVNFPRAKTIPSGYLTDLQVDLADFQKLSRHNGGYKYMLLGVCVLSKRIFAVPVRTKTPKDMCPAFEQLFTQMDMVPHRIFSDRGTEFVGATMKQFFKENEIDKYEATTSTIKASVAERAIRTIKQRIYRYFSQKQTLNWVNVLDQIVNAINHSKSRALGAGLRPIDVNFANANTIWERNYGPILKAIKKTNNKKAKFKLNDHVRMSRNKGVFEKGYLPNYGDEILEIDAIKKGSSSRQNPVRYKLRDERGEKFRGKFYEHELTGVRKDAEMSYRIEKVFGKRMGKDGKKQLYVKFIGYPGKEWIDESQLV